MTKSISTLFILTLMVFCGYSQDLLTVAEQTDFTSTSRHSEVMQFVDDLLKSSAYIRMDTLAITEEGKMIPLLILGNPLPVEPENLDKDTRIRVYIQANIHAGEVEGKEASLMLARDLLKNPESEIMKKCIILICPNLNADGNDMISKENRTNQNGPVNGVGVRYNGQFLDLNRDAVKLESPEIRGVVTKILNRWDPSVTVDCHTTNGSYHVEPITFTWMMNPNGSRKLINFMRDDMMPAVHDRLLNHYKVENLFYGEFADRLNIDSVWVSYATEPRYLVNYIGVRNRLAILNENYVYADYKTRVLGCYDLLKSILDYASANQVKIKELLAEADMFQSRPADPLVPDFFALEYEGRPTPEPITVKAYEADTIPGVKGYWRYKCSDRQRTVTVPYIADYYPTKTVPMPFAWLITIPDKEVLNLLKMHGIEVKELKQTRSIEVERFKISSLKAEPRLNQGHYTNNVKGEFIKETKEFQPGTFVVYTRQKLEKLATYLLEPQSNDSMLLWNFFDRYLVPQWGGDYYPYPVYKVMNRVEL